LTYGGEEVDIEGYPGFPIEFVETKSTLSSILPTSTSTSQVLLPSIWAIDEQFPSSSLIPSQEVALQDSYTLRGLPNLTVQVTRFACGGVGVGVKMTHSLADATTLVGFMHDWAKIHSSLTGKNGDENKEEDKSGEKEKDLVPKVTFDPSLLDSKASGDLSSSTGPDASILSLSRSLPLHRYDWLNSGGSDCPPWFEPITACPPGVNLADDHDQERGERMPWGEWDMLKPVRHTIFRFSAEEVDGIWKAATDTSSSATEGQAEQQEAQPVKLSRLDTLLAHIWKAVMRANQIQPSEESFLDMTFGLRTRLDLPARFLGSPLRQIAVPGNPSLSSSSLSRSIRSTLQRLDDKKACSALLHDLAYDTTGQNIWATFLGRRHLLCTSWTRLGVYDVDFGCGSKPEYVDAFMPASDGLLQIMEARPSTTATAVKTTSGEGQGGSPWWKDGASVSLHLAEETMARLIADEAFREFA
jgi:hypothetical protein